MNTGKIVFDLELKGNRWADSVEKLGVWPTVVSLGEHLPANQPQRIQPRCDGRELLITDTRVCQPTGGFVRDPVIDEISTRVLCRRKPSFGRGTTKIPF